MASFKKYNIEYYFWDITVNYDVLPKNIKDFILTNYNWLEPNGTHSWKYDRISPSDGHPNETGYIQLADHIYSAIKERNLYRRF